MSDTYNESRRSLHAQIKGVASVSGPLWLMCLSFCIKIGNAYGSVSLCEVGVAYEPVSESR